MMSHSNPEASTSRIETSDPQRSEESIVRSRRDIPESDIQPLPNRAGLSTGPWKPKGGEFFLTSQYYEREDGETFASLAESQALFEASTAAMSELVEEMGDEYDILVSAHTEPDARLAAARHAIRIALGNAPS